MAGEVKAVREGGHTITAHLVVNDASKAVEFYKNAFGAEILGIHYTPDKKKVMHAEVKIGDSVVMLADEWPDMGSKSPKTLGGSPVVLNLFRDNIDQLFEQAVKAGATVTMPLMNQFWGDRYGQLEDPFGHRWALGQHIEDVAPDEMERRAKEAFAKFEKMPKPSEQK
jgi:PhnB protein